MTCWLPKTVQKCKNLVSRGAMWLSMRFPKLSSSFWRIVLICFTSGFQRFQKSEGNMAQFCTQSVVIGSRIQKCIYIYIYYVFQYYNIYVKHFYLSRAWASKISLKPILARSWWRIWWLIEQIFKQHTVYTGRIVLGHREGTLRWRNLRVGHAFVSTKGSRWWGGKGKPGRCCLDRSHVLEFRRCWMFRVLVRQMFFTCCFVVHGILTSWISGWKCDIVWRPWQPHSISNIRTRQCLK